jgi:hypothetical protein
MVSKKIIQDLVQSNRPRIIEEGEYIGTIVDVEQRENAKGTNWISIGCESAEIGKVYVRYFFTDKAAKMAFRNLQTLAREFGLTIDMDEFEANELDYLCDLFGQLCGLSVQITVSGKAGNYNYKLNGID